MDKQSDIVKQVEAYNAGIQIDNGAAQDIYNFVTRHSREELKELGSTRINCLKINIQENIIQQNIITY